MLKISILDMSLKIIDLKLQQHFPEANELRKIQYPHISLEASMAKF